MNVQPDSNSSHSNTLVFKENRLKFVFHFVAATTLASILSIYPISLLQLIFSNFYPSDWAQPNLPVFPSLFDILVRYRVEQSDNGGLNWIHLFHAIVTYTLIGAFIGMFQRGVLQQYLSRGNWILATVLGYQISGLLGNNANSPILYYSLVCQGLLQWLILRQVARDAWVWLLSQPLAFFLTSTLGFFIPYILIQNTWVVSSILLGLIQAFTFCTFRPKNISSV